MADNTDLDNNLNDVIGNQPKDKEIELTKDTNIQKEDEPSHEQIHIDENPKKANKQIKKYQSRAQKTYDDDQSQTDDDGEDNLKTEQALKYLNTQGEMVGNKPNPRFKNYKELFNNLLKSTNVTTMYPICSVIITYDSTKAVTVTKKNEREYYVKMYDLESYEMTFEEKIGGDANDYIKLKEVEQNHNGSKFAIVYFNDGYFKLRNFEKTSRSEQEI